MGTQSTWGYLLSLHLCQTSHTYISNQFMSLDLENLKTKDPFNDWETDDVSPTPAAFVHIRIQQRNGRKTLTTCQGIPEEFDLKKILKAFKKEFCCNGTIVDDTELGKVIQLQGDQREKIKSFITREGMVDKTKVKVHGF